KKQAKEIREKVNKLEDVSYLRSAVDEELKSRLLENRASSIEAETREIDSLLSKLKEFHDEYLGTSAAIEASKAKVALKPIEGECKKTALISRTSLETALYEFGETINGVLQRFIAQSNSDEYVDLDAYHKEIDRAFLDAEASLSRMKEALNLEENEYVNKTLIYAEECSKTLYEAHSHGPRRLPEWGKGLLFCAPWILGFLVFTLYPLIQTIVFSFSSVNLTTQGFQSTFIGFSNYANIFTSDTDFLLALKSYLIQMVIYVPLITIFSLMLAMLLNTSIKGRGAFRVIFFFPVIITSGPVMKILIEQGVTAMPGLTSMFDINALTAKWPDFLREAFNLLTGEFVMILWFSGIQILVFLTALQKIDKSVYEASAIDGANRWEQFWKVTLPAINSSIVINVVFTTVMQSIFALNPIILKIQNDMNDTAEGKGYGYSSALAFSYFIVMIAVLAIFYLIFKRHNRGRKGAK
ncbi:MAG: ABC transporter permease subunit, partial [Bacilli bacterium]|nr:ABC transporter permease subunit [Bacilli bacterium]